MDSPIIEGSRQNAEPAKEFYSNYKLADYTERSMKKKLLAVNILLLLVSLVFWFAYPILERNYQWGMDPIRKKHVHQIVSVIQEFAEKTGHLPFQEQTANKPFMVLLGHSPEEEDQFANDPVLKRDATWTNSTELEALLSKELKRTIKLPRDPQRVPTFAPNVYVYFVAGKQMTVVTHLNFPDDNAVRYEWHGQPFYAYTICYDFEPKQ
jgi:hypothetical protein